MATGAEDAGDENPEEDAQLEQDLAMLDRHMIRLIEHFDTVHIFVTRATKGDTGETTGLSRGRGNWYARKGIVTEWVEKQE